MDAKIREAQLKVLEAFSKHSISFALAGGTALELCYFKHRFSKDLDFFSPNFKVREIERLVKEFGHVLGQSLKLKNQLILPSRARVYFYTVSIEKAAYPLKIDFVEDLFFDKPKIKRLKGIPVYDLQQIYHMKCLAVGGTIPQLDEIGRSIATGRNAARDVVDLYYLSKNLELLHQFLDRLPATLQRAMVLWYRTFSRQEFRFEFLDLEIYDKNLDSSLVVNHLDTEIKKFIGSRIYED